MVMQHQQLAKKLKVFYDLKEKPKHRYGALSSFLGSLEPSQYAAFMKEHSQMLIDFVVDSFKAMSDRIREDEEYRKRFQGGKGFEKHMFLVPLVSLCIKHLAADLGKSEKLSQVVNVLRSLLVSGNERHVRLSGMQLLLSWLKVKSYPPVILTLFASAIDLKSIGVQAEQEHFPVNHGEKALFELNPKSSLEESLELLEDTLKLITFDPEPDQHSTKIIFDALRTCYLEKIYQQEHSTPPQVQELIIKWTLHSEFVSGKEAINGVNTACLLIGELVESEAIAIQIFHKILASGLKLPYSHYSSIKTCLGILRSWLFNTIERQPLFIQEAANEYAHRYCTLLLTLFDRRPFIGFQREQVDTFQDAIYFLRALAMQTYFPMSPHTWETALHTALQIGTFLFGAGSADLIVTPALATELAHLYGETLWVAVMRSSLQKRQFYELLAITMQGIQHLAVFQEWSKIVHSLTDLLLASNPIHSEKSEKSASSPSTYSTSWIDLSTVQGSVMFLWKNSLRAVGDLFCGSRPVEIREEVGLTFARITDKLLKSGRNDVPLFELARVLLRVAYEAENRASRKAALSVTCRLYCLNQTPPTQSSIGMFFTVLKKALGDSFGDEGLLSVLLENTSDLYSQESMRIEHLVVLVPLYLDAIERLLLSDSPLLINKLWDVCRLLGDIFLSHVLSQERISGLLQRLYVWSKKDVNLEGPIICTVSNLIIQSATRNEEGLLGVLLEAIVPREDVVSYRAIEAIEALSFTFIECNLIIQRVILAIRACLLPVSGGDNHQQDIVGARILGILYHFSISEKLRDDVWMLLDECEHLHVVPGLKETEMGRAAKYLKLHLLHGKCSNHKNTNTFTSELGFYALMHGSKVGTILGGKDNLLQSRNVSGVNDFRFYPGEPLAPKAAQSVQIKSAQVISEVDPYYASEADFEDTLLEDLLQYSEDAAFTVDGAHLEDIMDQVQRLYKAECEHAAKYRDLMKQEYKPSKESVTGLVQSADYFNQLLTNLELLGLPGFEYQLLRDVNNKKLNESDQIAPKEVIQIAAPKDVLIENDTCLLKFSTDTNNALIGINQKASNVGISIKQGSIQIESEKNIVAAPLGYGTKLLTPQSIYPLLLPTLLQLNRSLTDNQEKFIHPYQPLTDLFRYSGRLLGLQSQSDMKETLSGYLYRPSTSSGGWRMKAAAIDGITATSPTTFQAPRYYPQGNDDSSNSSNAVTTIAKEKEMQIY